MMMTQKKATTEAVLDACRQLLAQGKPTSAANILAIVGGSKATVLEARRTALAALIDEGMATDPSAAFQAAADPLLRKLWTIGRQQAEASFSRQLKDMAAINEGLELDLSSAIEQLEEANRRVSAAEYRLTEMIKGQEEMREVFGVLAETLKGEAGKGARVPKPSPKEIEGVLVALSRIDEPATHELLYAEMAKDGWDTEAAHKARYRVMAAKFVEHVAVVTQKGRDWHSSNREAG